MDPLPTLHDIRAAARVIEGIAHRTPLVPAMLGDDLLLKLESLQPIGAFKLRGALNAMAKLDDAQKARGVACASAPGDGGTASAGGISGRSTLLQLSPLSRSRSQ